MNTCDVHIHFDYQSGSTIIVGRGPDQPIPSCSTFHSDVVINWSSKTPDVDPSYFVLMVTIGVLTPYVCMCILVPVS